MNANAFQALRHLIREEMARLRLPELGLVQDIHPHADAGDDDNYALTVRLRDNGTVLPHVPLATGRKGLAAIPDVGDLVLIQYLGGDANAPVATATFYNDEDRPPPNAEGEAVLRLPSDGGEGEGVEARVATADTAAVTLAVGAALKLTLQDDDPVVSIDVNDGAATVSIASDGTVSIASADLVLEGRDLAIKGTAVTIEAQGELTLKGAKINLN